MIGHAMGHLRLWRCLKITITGFFELRNLNDKTAFLDEVAEDAAVLLETLKLNAQSDGYYMHIPKDIWDKAWAEAKKRGE